MCLSVMAQPAMVDRPTGGVMFASAKFMIITMPKWIGSMPNLVAMGAKMGASRMISEVTSVRQPSTSSMALTISRNCVGVWAKRMKKLLMAVGTCSTVRIQLKPLHTEMTIRIVAELTAESISIFLKRSKVSSR